jgi:hypothetical protein
MSSLIPIFNITNKITVGLTRIERARGFLEAATLSEEWIREMGDRALVLEAHHTTQLATGHDIMLLYGAFLIYQTRSNQYSPIS